MNAKEFLQQYAEAERIAARYKAEYIKEVELIDAIRSSLGDNEPRGGGISKQTEKKGISLAESWALYEEAEYEALRIKRPILKVVNSIPGECGSVLYERYINLRKWKDVALAVGYSERQCYNIHNKALDMVEEMME